jgi:sporulation protein YlmC with PRC-barrel domain
MEDPDASPRRWLSELPALVIDAGSVDVRGWTVTTPNGTRVGVVTDLLVDIDHLKVEYLGIEDQSGSGSRPALLPLTRVHLLVEARQVVRDGANNLEPEIHVRYRSTWHLTLIAGALAAAAAWFAWAFGLFDR